MVGWTASGVWDKVFRDMVADLKSLYLMIEPLVHALVRAVAHGKIVPVRSWLQHSKHTVDENSVIGSRPAYRLHTP